MAGSVKTRIVIWCDNIGDGNLRGYAFESYPFDPNEIQNVIVSCTTQFKHNSCHLGSELVISKEKTTSYTATILGATASTLLLR